MMKQTLYAVASWAKAVSQSNHSDLDFDPYDSKTMTGPYLLNLKTCVSQTRYAILTQRQ